MCACARVSSLGETKRSLSIPSVSLTLSHTNALSVSMGLRENMRARVFLFPPWTTDHAIDRCVFFFLPLLCRLESVLGCPGEQRPQTVWGPPANHARIGCSRHCDVGLAILVSSCCFGEESRMPKISNQARHSTHKDEIASRLRASMPPMPFPNPHARDSRWIQGWASKVPSSIERQCQLKFKRSPLPYVQVMRRRKIATCPDG
jgi:hypothetical protein